MLDERRARYLQALGVDVWLRRSLPATPAMPATPPAPAVVPAVVTESAPVSEPVRVAEPAVLAPAPPLAADGDWETLEREVKGCVRCRLHSTRTQTVFGVGDRRARWMVIGEAPGADEDVQGEPFVGAAGQLLDRMLLAIDLPRDTVFIANILKCRPPGNRDPQPDEVACCLPYLSRQIALVRPALILCVGRIAAQTLLATETSVAKLRQRVHRYGALNTPLVVTYHPAYLLRSPGEKRKAWEDLKFARRTFAELAQSAP